VVYTLVCMYTTLLDCSLIALTACTLAFGLGEGLGGKERWGITAPDYTVTSW
jgi:hypothetical protein